VAQIAEAEAPAEPAIQPSSTAYRRYVMALLLGTCALNFLDRSVINILAEPIKREFHLRDWELGMLTGFYFAAFYSVLSIPLARLADRGSRARVITACLAVWSLFTAASGLARSYLQLAACRLLIGVGEAGGSPTAQSLISDYVPREKRASAIALYTIGIPIGSLLGLALGGLVLDRYGWRTAFIWAGAPGLALSVLCALTLKEPRRQSEAERAPALGPALREIFSKRAFILMTLGGSLVSFVNYAQGAFLPSYFFRNHGPELQVLAHGLGEGLGPAAFLGPAMGLVSGTAGIIGTLTGGWLTDWAARRNPGAYVGVQVIALALRLPLFALAMAAPSVPLTLAALGAQSICTGVAGAPAYAAIQGLVQPRVRVTAAAIFLLGLNLIGLGLGPVAAGALSDLFASHGAGAGPALRWALLGVTEVVLVAAMLLIGASGRTFVRDTVS
jgi:MFS family permease